MFFLSGRPVTVYVDLYIVDIGEISVTNMVRPYVVFNFTSSQTVYKILYILAKIKTSIA